MLTQTSRVAHSCPRLTLKKGFFFPPKPTVATTGIWTSQKQTIHFLLFNSLGHRSDDICSLSWHFQSSFLSFAGRLGAPFVPDLSSTAMKPWPFGGSTESRVFSEVVARESEHLLSPQCPVNCSDSCTVKPDTLCHSPLSHLSCLLLPVFWESFKKRFLSMVKSHDLPGEERATFKSCTFHQCSTWPGVQLRYDMSSQYWCWDGVKERQRVWCCDYLSIFSSFAWLSCHGTCTAHYTQESLGKIPLIGRAWNPWHCHVTLFFLLQEV